MCKFQTLTGECPFSAEPGEELCIFHLPLDRKNETKFWTHLASYICALADKLSLAPPDWCTQENDAQLFSTYQQLIEPGIKIWKFTGFIFPYMDEKHNFLRFQFHKDADFSWANFLNADFIGAQFHQNADFNGTQFQNAIFRGVQFQNNADFLGTQFHQNADFRGAKFQNACFNGTQFQNADFSWAQFQDADFRGAKHDGPVMFNRSELKGIIDFSSSTLRNRLIFAGTRIKDDAIIILWDLNFVHGISDITMEKNQSKGQLIEPAGQVVFRDIEKNIKRVSFLHTEIFSDRLYVRFDNVRWEPRPEDFIFDARFVFHPPEKWQEKTGLNSEILEALPKIFNTESPYQTGKDKKAMLADCAPLVRQDVERLAREIRRSNEEYGSYSDAGDFYIAEMEYRRKKTPAKPLKPLLFKLALLLYKLVSNYGESPSRALGWIFLLWFIPSIIKLLFCKSFSQCLNFSGYVLANMLALQYPAEHLLQAYNCPLIWTLHKVIGISVITLFLLAVRRRFSR